MSILFRTKEHLTLAELGPAWSLELVKGGEDPKRCEQNLVHVLVEDIVNGRLDNSGPPRDNGRRLGLRWITPENKAAFVEGHQLLDLLSGGQAYVLHRVVVTKEAVLDFAQRRQLPPPSWWTDSSSAQVPDSIMINVIPPIAVGAEAPAARGKQPRILKFLSERFPDGVPEPGLCPRHTLRSDILKWDPQLGRLDEATLKKAIEKHNTSLPKQKI